jgi:preprotein translocase subunit SecB
VYLEAHSDGQIGAPNVLNCQLEAGRDVENPKRFQVLLRVKLGSTPEKKATYTGEFHAVGLFHVAETWPADKREDLLESNGAAVLYGAVRELVLNLTARGPWPPITLSAFSFVPAKEKPREAGVSEITHVQT